MGTLPVTDTTAEEVAKRTRDWAKQIRFGSEEEGRFRDHKE